MKLKKLLYFIISLCSFIFLVYLTKINWLYFGVLIIMDIYYWEYINWRFWKKRNNVKKKQPIVIEWLNAIIFAVIGATLIHTFIIQPFTIPTSSMEKTMLIGDYLLVSKLSYGPNVPNTPLSIPFMHNKILGTDNTKSYSKKIQLGYNRLKGFNKVKNNDIVVFNYPADDIQDNMPFDKKTHYVKRCLGIAGDTFEIRNQDIFINNVIQSLPGRSFSQFSYIVEKKGNSFRQKFLLDNDITEVYKLYKYSLELDDKNLKLVKNQPYIRDIEKIKNLNDEISEYTFFTQNVELNFNILKKYNGKKIPGNFYMMMLTKNNFNLISKLKSVSKIFTPKLVNNQKNENMFPKGNNFNWDTDNYGPIYIPKKGDSLKLNKNNISIYHDIINKYEKNNLKINDDIIKINGIETNYYIPKMNYYWMVGDNRHNSLDSRFWGFVPENHIIGKPVFNWFSIDPNKKGINKIRWKRLFTVIHGEGKPKSYLIHFIIFIIIWNITSKFIKKYKLK